MDVILFLLKITARLALALTSLTAAAVIFLVNALTGSIAKRAHRNPAPQEAQPQPSPLVRQKTSPPATPVASAPAVHVHVHLETPTLQAATAPSPPPIPAPAAPTTAAPAAILSHPDHKIYLTTGSHLMMEHPESEGLLQSLDHMLYLAAHRDGKPFRLDPPLDDSRPAEVIHLPPTEDMDESVFDRTEPRPMPLPDGALWLRRAGRNPHLLATSTPS